MKKLLIVSLISLLTQTTFAYWYYQPYPISAQITTNGTQWRMECSVYDSLLGTTQTYNGPYCDTELQLVSVNNTGMVAYESIDNFINPDNYVGAVVYDMELHQFKLLDFSCLGCQDGNFHISVDYGVATLTQSEIGNPDYLVINSSYYDIKNGAWVTSDYASYYYGGYELRDYGVLWAFEADPDGDYDLSYMNPKQHEWTYLNSGWTPCNFPNSTEADDLTIMTGIDCFAGDNYGSYSIIGPTSGGDASFTAASNFGSGYGIIHWQDDATGDFIINTFDASTNAMSSLTLQGYDGTTFQKDNFMFCITDNSNTIVSYGVYSITQHAWITGSDTLTNPLSSVSLTNQTVIINPSVGSPLTRGYDDATGWGNFTTPQQSIFFLGNYNSPTEGNLIYVKDYSIATGSSFFDYGDGITTTKKSAFHLYKVNGHYRTTSAMNFNVCMTTTGAGGTQSNCQTVSFPTSVENIGLRSNDNISIKSTANKNIYEIDNKNGNDIIINVYNSIGQLIEHTEANNTQNFIDVQHYKNGMYIINAADIKSGQKASQKIVKR